MAKSLEYGIARTRAGPRMGLMQPGWLTDVSNWKTYDLSSRKLQRAKSETMVIGGASLDASLSKKPGSDFVGTVVLVCAVLAATAAGVLIAYGVCCAMFSLFRIHAKKAAQSPAVVGEPQTAEF